MKQRVLTLFMIFTLCVLTLLPLIGGETHVQAQNSLGLLHQRTGKITKSYRQGEGERPDWVEKAFALSIAKLGQRPQRQQNQALGLVNPANELKLQSAFQDDLGMTHVRMNQVYNGVPVFGGQLISHLTGNGQHSANGRVFAQARRVRTTPKITAETAIEVARAAINRKDDFAQTPTAELVVLPEAVQQSKPAAPGATLTYKVELFINNGTEAARHVYFINALNGRIEWYYNDLQEGTGNSQYYGTVSIGTFFDGSLFELNDRSRSDNRRCASKPGIITIDFGVSGNNNCAAYTDADDVWGNGTNSSRQTAGVDAHYGATLTYNYYFSRHNWSGLDGNNLQLCSRTYNNGNGMDNAFWDGQCANYGSGSQGKHWASVDVVGHEFTHGVTDFTANLIFSNQSGGSNESFSDIFGTMIEFYSGHSPDYLLGEDTVTGGIRIMSNPRLDGNSIDHISQYFNGIDPHFSSGVQNVAFYLLAEGGNHPTTGISVKRIGRDRAANIYHRALTFYLFPTANFNDVRSACEQATRDFYSTGNPIYHALQRSWFSTGIGADVPANPIDDPQFFVAQLYRDFLLREPEQGGLNFWTGQITQCGNDAVCEDQKRVDVSRAFWYSAEFLQQPRASNVVNPNPPPDFNNQEFVRLCYIIYLQRQPDQPGWDFWTDQLNSHNNYSAIIRAFLLSAEYRDRFVSGPVGCDPIDEQNCYYSGGIWDPGTCSCYYDPPPDPCYPYYCY